MRGDPWRDRHTAQQVFLQCAAGDAEAWAAFMRDYRPLLTFVVRRTLQASGDTRPEEVEECVSDAILYLLEREGAMLRAYDRRSNPSTWLGLAAVTVVHRRLRMQHRHQGVRGERVSWGALVREVHADECGVEEPPLLETIRQAVARLPVPQRCLIDLFYGAGLEAAAVARIMGMTPAAVTQSLWRARNLLREKMMHSSQE